MRRMSFGGGNSGSCAARVRSQTKVVERLTGGAALGRAGAGALPALKYRRSDADSVALRAWREAPTCQTAIRFQSLLVPVMSLTSITGLGSDTVVTLVIFTLRRDYIDGADLSRAAKVIEQMAGWIADYNGFTPHSALGERSPVESRREFVTT